MSTLTYEIRPDGLYIRSDRGWLALTPYTPRAIRVRYTLKPEFSARPSLMVVSQPEADIRFTRRGDAGQPGVLDVRGDRSRSTGRPPRSPIGITRAAC